MTTKLSGPNDDRDHWERRLVTLTRVFESVQAERGLAMHRLHQRGASVPEIAHLACEHQPEVLATLEQAANDPEIDDLSEGPRWVEMWPTAGATY